MKYWMPAIQGDAEFYVYDTPDATKIHGKLINHIAHVVRDIDWTGEHPRYTDTWVIQCSVRRPRCLMLNPTFLTKGEAKALVEKLFSKREEKIK